MVLNRFFSRLLTDSEKKHFNFLASGMIINSFIELFSLVAVMPFLGVAANPDLIEQNTYLSLAYNMFGFTNHRSFLLFLGAGLIVTLFTANCSGAFVKWFSLRFVWSVNNSLSVRLVKHYLGQDYLAFIQRNSADLQKNIQTEVTQLTTSVLNPILVLINKGFSVFVTIILLIVIDPIVVLSIGGVFGIIYFIVFSFTKKTLSSIGRGSLKDNEAKFKAVNEAFGVFKIAKLMSLEEFFINRFAKASMRFTNNQTKRMAISQLPRFAIETIAFSLMIGIGLYIISSKDNFVEVIPVLGLYVFSAYRLMPGIQQVYTNFSVIRSGWPHAVYLKNEFESIALSVEKSTLEFPSPLKLNSSSLIEFQNVTFTYPNTKGKTIDNVSFCIPGKASIGVMGETGSGKSTLIDLILGILAPDTGVILVNGHPLGRQNIQGWQRSIGYVPQDIYLTDNTVAENIAFGLSKNEINMDRVRKAANLANISNFVENELRDKYYTVVGERGIRLSGGQRQRIGIARALYREPELVIFDEATSALDNETEKSVMEAIDSISREKSIIIIAHRLTTLQKCDLIIAIEDGKVAKICSYDEVV
ncbi:ABC transporter ATP-binding protein [Desulfospira joergensenii]|uniref:ABC transporter ATP-binding protein n=1 Tax=Desulfospira joergensenii TaxID=53329 RepID=UPI0003B40BE0|nr:ABC transporter ATP-binding protein [Desulfospira joergensenii]